MLIDRNKLYGDPLPLHRAIGRKWGATLGISDIPPETVAMMMADLKSCRLAYDSSNADSWIDYLGYVALGSAMHR